MDDLLSEEPVFDRQYQAYGAAAELFVSKDREVLIEGGAGTGKTHAVLRKMDWLARTYPLHPSHPKPRMLMVRQTRKSMTESVLQEFEEAVLWPGHPAIQGDASRDHRVKYLYPGGTEIILGGLDNPDRLMSTQYDLVGLFEATEATLEAWDKLMSRVRHHAIPHPGLPEPFCQGFMPDGRTLWEAFRQGEFRSPDPKKNNRFYDGRPLFFEQGVCDCNPGSEYHWLNLRADEKREDGSPMMRRLLSRHEDNPTVTEDYLDVLRNLAPVQRKRLYEGEWVSEAGQVWETFDRGRNILAGRLEKTQSGGWQLLTERWDEPVYLRWFAAGVDWGYYPDPGAIIVSGFDEVGRQYVVRQICHLRRDTEWWADQICLLEAEFNLRRVACDSAENDRIKLFNDRLQKRGSGRLATKANKAVETGLDLVRDAFLPQRDGKAKLFILEDSLQQRDRDLADERRPYSLQTEIPSYVFPKMEDGKPNKSKPDQACDDHLCLAEGTLILMADGSERPIELVGQGQWVQTPLGPRRVCAAAYTGIHAVYSVVVGGRELFATGDHPVCTRKGFARADSLRYTGMSCVTIASTTTASCGIGMGDTAKGIPRGKKFVSTGMPGRSTEERYPTVGGGMSTTRMETRMTTASRTLSFSPRESTSGAIGSTPRVSWRKGDAGVVSAVRKLLEPRLAMDAGRSSSQARERQGSAGTVARQPGGFDRGWMMSGGNAGCVTESSSATATARPALAECRARVSSAPTQDAAVHSLAVDDARCFFANGVLVSNCDSLRYLSMFGWQKDLGPHPTLPEYKPGTFGYIHNHHKKWKRMLGLE